MTVVLLGAGTVGAATWYLLGRGVSHDNLILHKVAYGPLHVTITERGALESAQNCEINCEVKAGTKGSTAATTIKWVIEDGTQVEKGDLLIKLDDSGLIEQRKQQEINVATALANRIKAKADYDIQLKKNLTDIAFAENNLEIAILDLYFYRGKAEIEPLDVVPLLGYAPSFGFVGNIPWSGLSEFLRPEGGEYARLTQDVDGRILMARSDLEMWEERAAWSNRMSKRGYVTPNQAQADGARLQSARLALKKLEEEKNVLDRFTAVKERKGREGLIVQMRSALEQAYIQAQATEAQFRVTLDSMISIHEQELKRLEDVRFEIAKCEIHAPQPGLVVYHVPEQSRFSSGSRQTLIAQGEPVSEGQKLMQIPDLSRMVVNTKVHEAMISRVRPGLSATVRIEAFQNRALSGHVKSVATVASQTHFLSSDVKVYQTLVAIDETLPGLKPGMSAEVTILTDSQVENALKVPIQAIVGSAEMGQKRICYVMTPEGPEERTVTVGISNEKEAEIKAGLVEGEMVVLNPKSLVKDQSRIREGGLPNRSATNLPSDKPKEEMPPPERPAPGQDKAKTKGGSRGKMDPAQMKERFQSATPAQRKEMLQQVPEQFREKVKQSLKSQGIEVPD
ncbi:MAG: efflux RND transporter periplasmic adaptor subunit [Gemmataceae bacterium]